MIKIYSFHLLLLFLFFSCALKTKHEREYWSGTKQVKTDMETYDNIVNGICKRYYRNGQLQSKVRYDNGRLLKIYCVYDSMGVKLPHGNIVDGNGFAISYSLEYGTRSYSGYFKNGWRNGWWKRYSFRGELIDSIYFVDGVCEDVPSTRYLLY